MDSKLQKWREPNTENFLKYSSNIGSVKALEQCIFLERVMKDPIACENLISFNRFNKQGSYTETQHLNIFTPI
jgi:hypothetical protein